MDVERAVILEGARTPVGKFLGAFSEVPAVDLGIIATKAALERSGVEPSEVDEVVFGHARQAGNGPNPARQVAYRSGLGEETPAFTVNMACGSGTKAVQVAAEQIVLGNASVVIAGGQENMSRTPFLLDRERFGYRMGNAVVFDGMNKDGFVDPLSGLIMGETAENLAVRYSISREEQDEFALRSQQKADATWERRAREIAPVEVPGRKGAATVVERDEHPRPETTLEGLGKLKPVFDQDIGTITAGNSSGITDGAAAMVLMSESRAVAEGREPLARVVAVASAGVDPAYMGIGVVPAVRKILEKTGLSMQDFEVVELNEAFAAQVLACDRELKFDHDRLNPNGGAIALGHPIGMTGARIVLTCAYEMREKGYSLGLATLCISGGMGMAVVLERS
ncbi:MAG TPA: acetyl-CoA C-acyltransferase [Actinobacteria bacterium]|jgi:acetyl-CoA C-acetyltransferase|nr:acetyl-CoA C-acyltransferase [Actinomycetota bacterium]